MALREAAAPTPTSTRSRSSRLWTRSANSRSTSSESRYCSRRRKSPLLFASPPARAPLSVSRLQLRQRRSVGVRGAAGRARGDGSDGRACGDAPQLQRHPPQPAQASCRAARAHGYGSGLPPLLAGGRYLHALLPCLQVHDHRRWFAHPVDRKPPRFCWHLGCILPRVLAISLRAGPWQRSSRCRSQPCWRARVRRLPRVGNGVGCEKTWRALRRGARVGIFFLDGCGDRRRRGLLPGTKNEKLRLKIRQTLYQTACFVCRTSSQRTSTQAPASAQPMYVQ